MRRHLGWAFLVVVSFTCFLAPLLSQGSPEFRFRLSGDPETLDWNLAHTSNETPLLINLMEGLVRANTHNDPQPALAKRWEVSKDGKTYTFYLRENVQWSDGTPLEAQHFVDSWIRLLNPSTESSYAYFLFDVLNAKAFHNGEIEDATQVGIRAVKKNQLEIKLQKVVPYFLHIPTFWVTFPIRKDLIEKEGTNWASPKKLSSNSSFVTLGPYLLESFSPGKKITLKRNPKYYAKLSSKAPGHVVALVIPSDEQARDAFDQGSLDVFKDVTTSDLLKTLEKKSKKQKLKIKNFPYLSTYYLGFNTEKSPMKDPAVRKAVALAINKTKIPTLLQGDQQVANGWIPPSLGYSSNTALDSKPSKAKEWLEKAGYPEGEGLRRLDLLVEPFDRADKLAEAMSQNLKETLGISVQVIVPSAKTFQDKLASKDFDLFINHWGADYPDPSSFMEVFLPTSGINYTGWKNTDYETLVGEAGNLLDTGKRRERYKKAEDLLLKQNVVILPLFHKKNTVVLGPKVKRFELNSLNYLFFSDIEM